MASVHSLYEPHTLLPVGAAVSIDVVVGIVGIMAISSALKMAGSSYNFCG